MMWYCEECGWMWPLKAVPGQDADWDECDACGGMMVPAHIIHGEDRFEEDQAEQDSMNAEPDWRGDCRFEYCDAPTGECPNPE